MFSWFCSWFSSSPEDVIEKPIVSNVIKKADPIYYMSQDQLDNQIKMLKKKSFEKRITVQSTPLDMITKFAVNEILKEKKNRMKISEDATLSTEERRNKIKLFFEKKKKEREEEEEMENILSSPVLRRENKIKIEEYSKNKKKYFELMPSNCHTY